MISKGRIVGETTSFPNHCPVTWDPPPYFVLDGADECGALTAILKHASNMLHCTADEMRDFASELWRFTKGPKQ